MATEDKKITTSDIKKKKIVSNEDKHGFSVSGKELKGIISGKVKEEMKVMIADEVKKEIQKEIAVDKASLFTVFGIFASIVTFVSIEIQILKTLCDFWNVIGFSIIILASLLTFILILDYIGRGWRNDFKLEIKQFPWILTGFIILLFAIGFYSASFSAKEVACKDEAIFKKYESNFLDKQLKLEKRYNDKIQNLQDELAVIKK